MITLTETKKADNTNLDKARVVTLRSNGDNALSIESLFARPILANADESRKLTKHAIAFLGMYHADTRWDVVSDKRAIVQGVDTLTLLAFAQARSDLLTYAPKEDAETGTIEIE
jgi:hypothetical protein